MQHILVRLYIQQILLLFFLTWDSNNKASVIPQGALIVVLITLTEYPDLFRGLELTLKCRPATTVSSKTRMTHSSVLFPSPSRTSRSACPRSTTRAKTTRSETKTSSAIAILAASLLTTLVHVLCSVNPSARNNKPKKLERERAKHEMYAKTTPKKAEAYGKNVAEEGKQNDGPEDFMHPATVEPQRVVWPPRDPLGLAEAELKELKRAGVKVSIENADMDEKGHVQLKGPPPGADDDALFG
jgi:hypothetical protein